MGHFKTHCIKIRAKNKNRKYDLFMLGIRFYLFRVPFVFVYKRLVGDVDVTKYWYIIQETHYVIINYNI